MEIFAMVHVAIRLAGIFFGLVVLVAMRTGRCFEKCSAFFLTTKYD
jgi:hypothetical protein